MPKVAGEDTLNTTLKIQKSLAGLTTDETSNSVQTEEQGQQSLGSEANVLTRAFKSSGRDFSRGDPVKIPFTESLILAQDERWRRA